jgi:twitching motility protein PilT
MPCCHSFAVNMLNKIKFSDLWLESDGTACIKGAGGGGTDAEEVHNVPKESFQELYEAIVAEEKELEEKGELSGKDNSFRMNYQGISFRVSGLTSVEKAKSEKVVYFLRRNVEKIPSFHKLGYSKILTNWLLSPRHKNGLLVFCGSQVTGKTTSAASLIAARLTELGGHGVGFEDPPEMPLAGQKEFDFYQSQVSSQNMGRAIKNSFRLAAPNILLIGELRNESEVAREAINTALSSDSMLVVLTMHAANVQTAVEKLILLAGGIDGEKTAAANLSEALLGVIVQKLEDKPMASKKNGRTPQRVKPTEFLLVPFSETSESIGIRAKIKERNYFALQDNVEQQRTNLIRHQTLPE